MNLDKIKCAATVAAQSASNQMQKDDVIVALLAKFPSEKDTLMEALRRLDINYDTYITASRIHGFVFYIVFDHNDESSPAADENYIQTEHFWYVFRPNGITRICKYKSVIIMNTWDDVALSNEIIIPEITVAYDTDIANIFRFDISSSRIRQKIHNLFPYYDTDIFADFVDEKNGRLAPFVKDSKIVAHNLEIYTVTPNMGAYGFIGAVYFYPEGNANGESILIKKETSDKLDNPDFESKYEGTARKHVLNSLTNMNIDKALENYLCETFKKCPETCSKNKLTLEFEIGYDETIYELSDNKPNVEIGFTPISLYCTMQHSNFDRLVSGSSDNKLSIEMSDMFWKHHGPNGCSGLSLDYYSRALNRLDYEEILDDADLNEEILDILVDKIKQTGLTIMECAQTKSYSDQTKWNISIQNPASAE